jgi:hypothetical protein
MRPVQSVKLLLVLALGSVGACGDDGGHQHVHPDSMVVMDAPAVNMTTALTAMLNADRTLDNAGYGVNTDGTLHVEIHKGGFTGCPEMTSPQQDYTLILGRVPAMTGASATPSSATFLDFIGDMTDNSPQPSTATVKTLTNVTYSAGAYLAIDVSLMFAEGTITGHLYAPHCTSLDG